MNCRAHAPARGRHRADQRRPIAVGVVGLVVVGLALIGGVLRVVVERSSAPDPERTSSVETFGDSASASDTTTPSPPPASRPPTLRDVPDPTATVPASPSSEQRAQIPASGPGTFDVVGGEPPGGSSTLSYTVEIERGLPFAPRATASIVDATLADDRGWVAVRGETFRRVVSGADVRIIVATPETTDRLCAPLATRGRVSCRNGALVVLNARRWAFGVPHYGSYLTSYRRYLVNHEVGHALGEAHVSCPGQGKPAPVMLQQTYGLEGCRRNPWPEVA